MCSQTLTTHALWRGLGSGDADGVDARATDPVLSEETIDRTTLTTISFLSVVSIGFGLWRVSSAVVS